MAFEESVLEVVRALSGTVLVDSGPAGATMVRCPEIPDLLLLPTRGGSVDADAPFSNEPSVVIWEDLWTTKNALMRSRLLSMFGKTRRIHARECEVQPLTKPQLFAFLKQHHLHVPTAAKTKLGLVREGELVAVASFGKQCPIDRDGRTWQSAELIRFCNASGTTVVGGLSKLIKHYIRTFSPEDIMTYADREWSSGGSYRRLKFKEVGVRKGQTFWVQPGTLQRFYPHEHAAVQQEAGLDHWNEESLLEHGWTRLRNRGSLKFILELV